MGEARNTLKAHSMFTKNKKKLEKMTLYIYTDETFVHSSHTTSHQWSCEDDLELNKTKIIRTIKTGPHSLHIHKKNQS